MGGVDEGETFTVRLPTETARRIREAAEAYASRPEELIENAVVAKYGPQENYFDGLLERCGDAEGPEFTDEEIESDLAVAARASK